MRSIVRRILPAVVGACLIMMSNTYSGQGEAAAQQRTPVTVTRIYAGSDGQTHAEQVDVKVTPGGGKEQSERVKVTSSYFLRFPPGFVQDWHPVTTRRYLITLSGQGEIELAGGRKIPLGPGQILQAEDLSGKGHITRTVGKKDWTALEVQFDQ